MYSDMRINAKQAHSSRMKIESLIRVLAGTVILAGVGLTWAVSPWWLLLPAFVGVNLIQSAFTGFCPPSLLLARLGWLDSDGTVHFFRRTPART